MIQGEGNSVPANKGLLLMKGLKPIEPLIILLECPRLPYQQGKVGQNSLLTSKEKLRSSPCIMHCLEYT